MNLEDKDNLTSFLLEIQKLQLKMEQTIKDYGYEHSVISLNLCGVLIEEDETDHLKAIYGYNVPDSEILEEVLDFIRSTYDPDDDLGELLDGLGISLN
tara:strand:- start:1739 stop:2032 length:294 start_codon:yes stop_codon:yes gene_type:complete